MAVKKKAPQLVSEHGQWTPTPPKTAPKMPVASVPGANGGDGSTPAVPASADYAPATEGYTPDYAELIKSDPIFQQMQADLSAQGISDAAARKAATDQALIRFGEVPDLSSTINGLGLDPNSPMFQMLFGDVDQVTRNAAGDLTKAGLSTTARLGHAHDTALGDLLQNLAARGSIRSGATGVGTGLENQNYLGAQFDARSQLLDYLSGVQHAFTTSEQARQAQLRQGATDATGRQIVEHPAVLGTPAVGTPGQPAQPAPVPNLTAGSSGYDVGGNIVPNTPPPPSTIPVVTKTPNQKGPYIGTLVNKLNL